MPAWPLTTTDRHADQRRRPRRGRWAAAGLAVMLGAASVGVAVQQQRPEPPALDLAAAKPNPVTPGNFTGYGFDQCDAPSQAKMDRWLQHSPFLAVGIYISGDSRACKAQPNLTATWVRRQLAGGWRLLPITLGPQSTCVGRFPRYGKNIDPTISNSSTSRYYKARVQGRDTAIAAVKRARALGIAKGSTLFYDLEGWSNYTNATCRESALNFLSAWTNRINDLGYVSGVYSSAGSGLRILDDARAQGRANIALPRQVWIARWDGKANTSAPGYVSDAGWKRNRLKQYQGGHNETWGKVTINIDRNYLDLGNSTPRAHPHCGGVHIDLSRYLVVKPPTAGYTPGAGQVRAIQCLLKERNLYTGPLNGKYTAATQKAVKAWQRKLGLPENTRWQTGHWMIILSGGMRPVQKVGSRGEYVRRMQRALRAAMPERGIATNGIYNTTMRAHVRAYRTSIGMVPDGIGNATVWRKLQTAVR